MLARFAQKRPYRLTVLALLVILLNLTGCTTSSAPASSETSTSAPTVPVSFVTTSLPNGVQGATYRANLQAVNGIQPYTFSISGGALPAGLGLSATGGISGTPTAYGTFSFVAQVADASQAVAAQTLTLTIEPPLSIVTAAFPTAQVTIPYSSALQIRGGLAPYTVTLASGTLPTGLALSSTGTIAGTPTVYGTYTFSLSVTDSYSPRQSASAAFTFTVVPAPLLLSYTTPVTLTAGISYYQAPAVSGGIPPYTYTLTSGTLPTGLALSTTAGSTNGAISGTPAAVGSFSATLQVTDSETIPQITSAPVAFNVFNAVVAVNTASTLAIVPQTGFGMHTSVYDPSLSDTAALPALLAATGITTLRYPGGSYADLYHWAQYTLTPTFASATPACNIAANGYLAPHTDFGYFLKTLAATGTQAMITVNYGTSLANASGTSSIGTYGPNTCSEPNTGGQPQEAAAWVAYANGSPNSTQVIGLDAVGFDWKTVGFWASLRAATPLATDDGYNFLRQGLANPIGIKYWELGNEIYYNGFNSNINTEADNHAPYVYPTGYTGTFNSRAGLATLSPTAYGTNAVPYIQAMRAVDPTIKIGFVLSANGVDPIPATWNPTALSAVCSGADFDFGILHYYPGTYNAVTGAQLLSLPQTNLPALVTGTRAQIVSSCPTASSAFPLFITETNSNGSLAAGTPTVVTGLYAAHVFLSAFESGAANIEWLELHDTSGSYLALTTETPGPAFYGIELAHLLAGIGDSLVTTSSTSPTLIAHATLKLTGQKGILLLNADPANASTVQVTVSGSSLGATATQYSYGLTSTQTTSALPPSSFAISGQTFTITVPPYTATELLIP
jgi:hypothetical protein